jgi:N-acetylmuramoyl-L-alanine amidase
MSAIVISSGHGLHIRGARDIVDEVDEARKVTNRVAEILRNAGEEVIVFHDETTRKPAHTVTTIVNFHNKQTRKLDVSVHFNAVAGGTREAGIGVETLYRTGNAEMKALASKISKAICDASGMILRRGDGTMSRNDLGFLNRSNINRAVLLEVCFVNSQTDVRLYRQNFEKICQGIAAAIIGKPIQATKSSYPVAPENIRRMVELGVTNDPDYWQSVTHVQWLNELLAAAGREGCLDNRIENGIKNSETALEVLRDAGITSSPDYWRGLAQSGRVKHLDSLLICMAERARIVLEKIIHAEAQGEDLKGQILVGNVILNRHKSPRFPNGIREVVFASGINSRGEHVYQFSPIGNGAYARANPSQSVKEAVSRILSGEDHSQGALFFRTIRGAEGSWHEQALTKLFDHGAHRFFS